MRQPRKDLTLPRDVPIAMSFLLSCKGLHALDRRRHSFAFNSSSW